MNTPPVDPPKGYRFLTDDEDVQIGDLAWNIIGGCYEVIGETLWITAQAFGSAFQNKNLFKYPPIRRIRD